MRVFNGEAPPKANEIGQEVQEPGCLDRGEARGESQAGGDAQEKVTEKV